MLRKFEKKLDRMDASLTEMITFLDGLSTDKMHHKPNGKWSPAQVFQHLHDAEIGTKNYLDKKLQAPPSEVPSGGIGGKVRSFMLKRALRSRKNQFKAPEMLAEISENPNYPELRQSYLNVRKDMRATLEGVETDRAGKAYFKHPRAGRLTISQTLDFLEDHFDRHFEQIKARLN
jgi:hypothetical protein